MVPHPSSLQLRLLLGLRQSGIASTEVLADRLSEPARELGPLLSQLAGDGLVEYLDGRMTGWMMTASGRECGEALLKSELDETKSRACVERAYRDFRALNRPFLQVCSDWQVRSVNGTDRPNDHTDFVYDRGVVSRLGATHIQLMVVLGSVSERLERYQWYEPSLSSALRRLNDGDRDYFTKPLKRSYHSIWFELHEDLLATLNLNRASEGA